MQIVDGCISRRVLDASKEVIIPCQEQSIVTNLQDVLVWRKRGWVWMKSNEVNDGSQVVHLYERPLLATKLDPERFLRGLSLYQEYDEMTDEWKTYLYKFSKDEAALARVQGVLDQQELSYQVKVQDRFVTLEGERVVFPDDESLLVMLTHAVHSGLFSFLLGLVLAYGVVDSEDEILHTIHIRIPLVGSIAQHRFLIDHMVVALRDIGIFISQDIQDQTHGQVMQLMLTDWEGLYLLHRWLGDSFGLVEVSKWVTYQEMKKDLLFFIQQETNDMHIYEKVEYGVVKLLRK